jgi:adenine deaminase
MNRVVRHAIDCGCDPLVAIQMATINTASHFGMERELGSITPGRRADFIVTSSIEDLPIDAVFARGERVAENGKLLTKCPHYDWPQSVRETVNLGKKLAFKDFSISLPSGLSSIKAKVIGVIENQAPTKALEFDLPVEQEKVQLVRDVCYLSLVERHRGTGKVVNGFVSGFGYTGSMAIASSVAHDSHHMIVVGTNQDMMASAANRLGEVGGGVSVWKDGSELALVELPIAGLMSDSKASEVAVKTQAIISAMSECGCILNNAYMQHTLLALVVIPELRISDLGLVDVNRFELISALEPNL